MLNAFLTPQSTFYSTSFWIINRPEALKAVSRNLDNSVDELNDDLDKDDEVTMNLGMDSDMVMTNDSVL